MVFIFFPKRNELTCSWRRACDIPAGTGGGGGGGGGPPEVINYSCNFLKENNNTNFLMYSIYSYFYYTLFYFLSYYKLFNK